MNTAIIERVRTSAYRIPTDHPESDGTFAWDHTTVVVVEVCAGELTGLGYTYASRAAAVVVDELLAPLVRGRKALEHGAIVREAAAALRNVGRCGLGALALSALDTALWDLHAQRLGTPLADLLGRVRSSVEGYGSGGFTSYDTAQLQQQLGGWAREGFRSVKMKVGRDPAADVERVRLAREAIGDAALFVDANGAYTRKQALRMAEQFARFGVRWFEEPVSSQDLEGLKLLRDRAPALMQIAAGEYGWDVHDFRGLLEGGAVDVLQADATRCGGVSGFLEAGVLCRSHGLPLSAHTAPSLHAHLGCVVPELWNVECFHDHLRIERLLFDGAVEPRDGMLRPGDAPGLGMKLRRAEASVYAL